LRENIAEIGSLATLYDVNYGPFFWSQTENMTVVLSYEDSTSCLLPFLCGKLLVFFDTTGDVGVVIDELDMQRVFELFWFFMLNWGDVESTRWPVFGILEFFAYELRIASLTASVADPESQELWSATFERSPPWMMFSRLGSGRLATATNHLTMALVAESLDETWVVRWFVSLALLWIRSVPPPSPLVTVLRSTWPVLLLWRRLWRSATPMAKLRCYALPGPLWDLRKAESEVFVKALPRGVWPLSSRSPASLLMGAREVWASAISVEEHADPLAWVDSVRVLHASIRKHEPPSKRRPFVVLVDADFPDRFSESLESDGIEVVWAESVHVPDFLAKCGTAQRRADGLRLQLFGLTKYNKIVYLDADTLVVGDISHLFSTPSGIFLSATINGSRWVTTVLV